MCQIPAPLAAVHEPTASLTVAASFVVREDKARLAGALEAAGGVGAGAKLADVGLHLTLVDIWEGMEVQFTGVCVCLVCVGFTSDLPMHWSFCTWYPGGQIHLNDPSRF